MADTTLGESNDNGHAWGNSATRDAILTAARRMRARDGVAELSLAAVADEANFAPATVYAYFANKSELLYALDNKDSIPKPTGAAAELPANPEIIKLLPPPEDPKIAVAAEKSRSPVLASLPQLDRIDTAISQLQDAVARLEARPVDVWLERRLRELERALDALSERQKKSERFETEPAGDTAESLRDLRERLDRIETQQREPVEEKLQGLAQRSDAQEQRLRQMISDIRAEASQSFRRLTALENAAFAASPEFFQKIPPHPVAHIPETAEPANNAPAAENGPEAQSQESYMAAARRAAQGVVLERVDTGPDKEPPRRRWPNDNAGRTAVALGCSVVLIAILVGARIILHAGTTGAEASVAPVSTPTAPPPTHVRVADTAVPFAQPHLMALAKAGNAKAELLVGIDYLDGRDVAKDATRATQWLTRAAEHGEPVAQYRLGMIFQQGLGVPLNSEAAFRLFEAAALQGNRKAMHSLGSAYAEGWGVAKNYVEAARWFSRAAQLGFVDSQFNLAVLYERGLGEPQSLPDAYKWYSIAAAQGDRESQSRIVALKTQMSPLELTAAEQDAAAFRPDPLDRAVNFVPQLSELPSG